MKTFKVVAEFERREDAVAFLEIATQLQCKARMTVGTTRKHRPNNGVTRLEKIILGLMVPGCAYDKEILEGEVVEKGYAQGSVGATFSKLHSKGKIVRVGNGFYQLA
jgi:hypothetical protein